MNPNALNAYMVKVFQPPGAVLGPRPVSAQGLVATYDHTKIFNVSWQYDKNAMITSAQFQGIPQNRDGSVNLDIRKGDVIEFVTSNSLVSNGNFCAVVDVAPHPDSRGGGVLGSEEQYETYKLVSPLTLLETTLMPNIFISARYSPDFQQYFLQPRTLSQLVALLASTYNAKVKFNASHIDSSYLNEHPPFYQPRRTMLQVFESLKQAANDPLLEFWIDAEQQFHFEHLPDNLENLGALDSYELLPTPGGPIANSVTLLLANSNRIPSDLNGKVEIVGPSLTLSGDKDRLYAPGTLEHHYQEVYTLVGESAYGPQEKSYQLAVTENMKRLNSEIIYNFDSDPTPAFNNVAAWIDGDLSSAITNSITNQNGEFVTLNATVPLNTGGKGFGFRLVYKHGRDTFTPPNGGTYPASPFLLLYEYLQGNQPVTFARVDMPFTGGTPGDAKTFDYSFVILADRTAYVYDKLRVSLIFQPFALRNAGAFSSQFLQVFVTNTAYLNKLAKNVIVVPLPDNGEYLVTQKNDTRPISGAYPTLGHVGPYTKRVAFTLNGVPYERKLESMSSGISQADGVYSLLRWGRPDPATVLSDFLRDDAGRQIKKIDGRILETTETL